MTKTNFRRFETLVILAILIVAFILRIYRLDMLLGFYYDQGRDALVIRDFLYSHKLFLVGPTTGVEGIFLGPLFYLTLLPWYWLGGGDPVFPAIYQAATTVISLFVLAKVGAEMFGKRTSFVFLLLGSFSYWIVVASRWLANPTQLMLASSLAILGLWRVVQGNNRYWLLIVLTVSAGLQFEAASATFFLPAIAVFLLLNRKTFPKLTIALASLGIFVLFFLPQVLFDFRHDHILFKSFSRFLISEHSFQVTGFISQLQNRASFLSGALLNKLFPNPATITPLVVGFLAVSALVFRKLFKEKSTQILLIWLVTPIIGLTVYRGNHGYVWDYYLTGVYLVFLLLVSAFVTAWWENWWGKVMVISFMSIFFWANLPPFINFTAGVDGPTHVTLGNEKMAVDWLLDDVKATNTQFNVDVYVPPVIAYSYDYLLWWQGNQKKTVQTDKLVPRLYTLYEVDPPHPERLSVWLKRQDTIGSVDKVATFGGVTVERRTRIPKKDK